MNRTRWIVVAGIVLVVVAGGWWWKSHGQKGAPKYRTAAVERSLQAGGASGRATSLADGALGGEPFRVELAEFARAIEANVTPRTDGEDALETLRLALAADQSARSFGRTVRLEAGAGA